VFITEYPDLTTNADGKLCSAGFMGGEGTHPFDCWGPLERGISATDFAFLKEEVVAGLNSAGEAAARANDWSRIGGILHSSEGHGLCNCDHGYFNTLGQSDHIQGDLYGSVHPNVTGYLNTYAVSVSHDLRRHLITRLTHPERERDEVQVSHFAALPQPVVSGHIAPNVIKAFMEKLRQRGIEPK
jgi:hypothetical protein